MARPLRIQYDGAWYHVMNRGAEHRTIFLDDTLRSCFLALLKDLHETYAVETHAFCLMDNHYHLLLHTLRGNLARAMRHLNGVYTQKLNRRLGRDGPIFRGRYHSVLIDADEHLLVAARYIHRNPVESNLVGEPEIYRWSSHAAYVGLRPAPPWLRMDVVLSLMAGQDQRRRFHEFVTAHFEEPDENPLARPVPIYGDERFVDAVRHLVTTNVEVPTSRVLETPPSIETIVDATASSFNETREDVLLAGGRGKPICIARDVALFLCRTLGGHTLRDIARAFGMTHYSSISQRVRRVRSLCEQDPELARHVGELRALIEGEKLKIKT